MSLELDAKVHAACKEETSNTLRLQLVAAENTISEMERKIEDLENLVDTLSKERDRLVLEVRDASSVAQRSTDAMHSTQNISLTNREGTVTNAILHAEEEEVSDMATRCS